MFSKCQILKPLVTEDTGGVWKGCKDYWRVSVLRSELESWLAVGRTDRAGQKTEKRLESLHLWQPRCLDLVGNHAILREVEGGVVL